MQNNKLHESKGRLITEKKCYHQGTPLMTEASKHILYLIKKLIEKIK